MSKHICDCGQTYSSIYGVEACQFNNHGQPRRADGDELAKELERAKRALVRSGFEDLGGQEWKPPVNRRVAELQERVNELTKALEKIEAIKCGEYSTLYLLDEARIIARAALARHAEREA